MRSPCRIVRELCADGVFAVFVVGVVLDLLLSPEVRSVIAQAIRTREVRRG